MGILLTVGMGIMIGDLFRLFMKIISMASLAPANHGYLLNALFRLLGFNFFVFAFIKMKRRELIREELVTR